MLKDEEFGTMVARMLPLMIREFTKDQKDMFSKGFLTVPQLVIIEFLAERDRCKMKELAKTLNFTMSAVTAIVDKMIEANLVKRERSSQDRRVVNVLLLNKGRDVARRVMEARRELTNNLFSSLTGEEKSEYVRILKKVYDNLLNRR